MLTKDNEHKEDLTGHAGQESAWEDRRKSNLNKMPSGTRNVLLLVRSGTYPSLDVHQRSRSEEQQSQFLRSPHPPPPDLGLGRGLHVARSVTQYHPRQTCPLASRR